MRLIIVLIILSNNLFAQISTKFELKLVNQDSWVEYKIPLFLNNITPEDYGSPHYNRFDFESRDKKVKIFILVNNSYLSKYRFNLKEAYKSILQRKDYNITYKVLRENSYYISGNLKNGRVFYEFCKALNGYGYTYSIEYDRDYLNYFNKTIPEIVRSFKILR
jgi:hypothetical protein